MNVLLLNSGYSLENELGIISQLPEVLLQSIASLDTHRRPMDKSMDAVHGQLSSVVTVLDLADREGDERAKHTAGGRVRVGVAGYGCIGYGDCLMGRWWGRRHRCKSLDEGVSEGRTFALQLIRHLDWLSYSIS